ncbi:MAG: septum formation family protein [Kibdelosporangium sp.]
MTQPPPSMPPPPEGPSGQYPQDPPPGPYGAPPPQGQNPYAGQYMSPPPPNLPPPVPPKPQRSKTFLVIGIVVAAVVVAGIAATIFSNTAKRDENTGQVTKEGVLTVFDLKGGDCFNNVPAEDKEIESVNAVPCGQPHDAEVLAEVTVTATGDYPGVDKVAAEVEKLCVDKVGARIDRSPIADRVDMYYLYPTAESWKMQKDRGGTCVAVSKDTAAKLTAPVGN